MVRGLPRTGKSKDLPSGRKSTASLPKNTSAFPWAMALPVDSRHRWTAATLKLHLHRVTVPSGEVPLRYTSVVPRLGKLSPLAVENLCGKLTFFKGVARPCS